MISIAMIALFAAVSPAQEVIEDVDSQEVCEEALVYEETELSDEIVFEDHLTENSEEQPDQE